MNDTLTTDTVNSTIATLREMRDGLRKTLMEEEHERAKRTEELINTATQWADRFGIGGFEQMMEELTLPVTPKRRAAISNGGFVTIHTVVPQGVVRSDLSGANDLVDTYSEVTVAQKVWVGPNLSDPVRTEGCVCSYAKLLDHLNLPFSRIRAAIEKGCVVTIEADLSCDSPDCHHGEGEPVAQVDEAAEVTAEADDGWIVVTRATNPNVFREAGAYINDDLNAALLRVDLPESRNALLIGEQGAWGIPRDYVERHGIPSRYLGKQGTWLERDSVVAALAADAARFEQPQRCDTDYHPSGEHVHVDTGSSGVLLHGVVENRDSYAATNGWTVLPGTFIREV